MSSPSLALKSLSTFHIKYYSVSKLSLLQAQHVFPIYCEDDLGSEEFCAFTNIQ